MRLPTAPAIATVPAIYRLRSLMAALAGFVAVLAIALLVDQALRSIGLPPPAAQPMPELGRQALAAWLRAASLFACGVLWSKAERAARSH